MSDPMQMYRILHPQDGVRDEDDAIPDGGTFLVGRDEEVGLLTRRWAQSQEVGCPKGVFRGCAPEVPALKCRLNVLGAAGKAANLGG